MRAAPPCRLRLPDSTAERAVLRLLHALAGAAFGAWLAAALGWRGAAAAVVILVPAAWAAGPLQHWAAVPLRWSSSAWALDWSGRAWSLVPAGARAAADPPARGLAALAVAIDAGAWLLLRAHGPAGEAVWLVLRPPPADAAGWALLRSALASHGGTAAAPVAAVG